MPTPAIAKAPVAEHSLIVFYDMDGLDPQSWTGPSFGELSRNDGTGIPVDQKPAIHGRYASERIWEPVDGMAAGADFHPHLRALLSGERRDLVRFFKPTDRTRRFIANADLYPDEATREQRVRKQVRLQLSKAADMRIASSGVTPCVLTVLIEEITLALFMTAHGFAICRFCISREDGAPLTAIELLEAHIAIGRFNEVRWINRSTRAPVDGDAFTLGTLVRQLVYGSRSQVTTSGRVTSYSYVRFDHYLPVEDRDRYGLLLARHYSTDYAISDEVERVVRLCDFETVRHTIGLEGAATVIAPSAETAKLPEYLRNFRRNTLDAHYAPITLLALHEHAFLVGHTAASVMSTAEMKDTTKSIKRLSDIRESALVLRLCYRFSEQSYITMHNALNLAWRKVLRLDEMLDELDNSIRDIAQYLQNMEHEAKEKKYAWAATLGTASLAGLTGFTIFKEGLGLMTDKSHAGWAGLAAGILIGLTAYYFGKQKGRSTYEGTHKHEGAHKHEGHFSVHTMLEHMIKRAQSQ